LISVVDLELEAVGSSSLEGKFVGVPNELGEEAQCCCSLRNWITTGEIAVPLLEESGVGIGSNSGYSFLLVYCQYSTLP